MTIAGAGGTSETSGSAPPLPPERARSGGKRRLFGVASVLGSAFLLAAVLGFTDANQILEGLRGLELSWLVPALVLHVLQVLVLGKRWAAIAELLEMRLRWGLAATEYALSIVLNLVLPTGMAGDAWRAVRVARAVPAANLLRAVESIALDRASGQVALWILLLGALPFSSVVGATELKSAAPVGFGALVLLGMAYFLLSRAPYDWAAVRAFHRFARRAASLLFSPRRALLHLPWSLLFTSLSIAQWYVAARAVGVELSLGATFILGPWLLLAASVPSLFGGWGIREAGAAVAFGVAGLDAARGVTVSVAYGLLGLTVTLPGLFVLLLPGRNEQDVLEHSET